MHGARRHGITLDRSGTAGLRTITDSAPIRAQGASMEEILQIVEADSKDRFQILRASSGPGVGAVQGHSRGSGVVPPRRDSAPC